MHVYLIESDHPEGVAYKIGFTRIDPNKRLKQLSTGNHSTLSIVKLYKSEYAIKIERYLHKYFKYKQIKNEWFMLDENDINDFNSICAKYEKQYIYMLENNYYMQK